MGRESRGGRRRSAREHMSAVSLPCGLQLGMGVPSCESEARREGRRHRAPCTLRAREGGHPRRGDAAEQGTKGTEPSGRGS